MASIHEEDKEDVRLRPSRKGTKSINNFKYTKSNKIHHQTQQHQQEHLSSEAGKDTVSIMDQSNSKSIDNGDK
eukprot:13469837-Ditylum_brightwellii.AAC.1